MDEILITVVAIVIAVFLYIFGPIYNNFSICDTYIDNHVRTATNNFQKEVRKNGYVDLDTYNKFLYELSKTKKVYKIELIHGSKLVYPKGINDYQPVNIKHGNIEIYNQIFSKKKYLMRYGDNFKVTINETEVANSRILSSIKKLNLKNNLMTFSSGGVVENEVN